MMGPNLEIPSDIIPPLQMKNVRHSMSRNVIQSQRPFVTVLLTTKLIGMCYSHFGNGIRNGTISILHNGVFLMIILPKSKLHWSMGKNSGYPNQGPLKQINGIDLNRALYIQHVYHSIEINRCHLMFCK